MKSTPFICLFLTLPLLAQDSLEIHKTDTANTFELSWDTVSGRSYFLQWSTDLDQWKYLPMIETGDSNKMQYGFQSNADAFFARVQYTDIPAIDPKAADFDGDGISNWNEVRVGGTGTDPFLYSSDDSGISDYDVDSDGGGLPDGWEIDNGVTPGALDPNGDEDNDGLTNLEESQLGTSPHSTNTDGDDFSDAEDAMPTDGDLNWKRTPQYHYAVVDLGAVVEYDEDIDYYYNGVPAPNISRDGKVVFDYNGIWDPSTQQWYNYPDLGLVTDQDVADFGSFDSGLLWLHDCGIVSGDFYFISSDYLEESHEGFFYDFKNGQINWFNNPIPRNHNSSARLNSYIEAMVGETTFFGASRIGDSFSESQLTKWKNGTAEPFGGGLVDGSVDEVSNEEIPLYSVFSGAPNYSEILKYGDETVNPAIEYGLSHMAKHRHETMNAPLIVCEGSFWVKNDAGQWVDKKIYKDLKESSAYGSSILGITDDGTLLNYSNEVWRNGVATPLTDLILSDQFANYQAHDVASNGLIVATAKKVKDADGIAIPEAQQKEHVVILRPVGVVELAPTLQDDEGNEIEGSDKPNTGDLLTPLVEIEPHINKIAHRELKVQIGKALSGKNVTWRLGAVPNAMPATIRGEWTDSTTHKDYFEASEAFGEHDYESIETETVGEGDDAIEYTTVAQTKVSNDGYTAIRVNVPPIGLNQVRIQIEIEGTEGAIDLIDMEVPAVVVLDPGHGGNDSGAIGRTDTSVHEADLVLAYGLQMRDDLIEKFAEEQRNVRVVMTRETDRFIELPERAPFANRNGADVFVSIHFNAATATTARGSETFIERLSSQASAGNPGANVNQQEDALLARALNQSIVDAIVAQDAGGGHRPTFSNNWVQIDGVTAPGVKRAGKLVTRDGEDENGNTEDYHPVKACLIEVEFLSHETALNTVKLSEDSGETIKNTFAESAAEDIFNNIQDQP